jgi:hypothetical protein
MCTPRCSYCSAVWGEFAFLGATVDAKIIDRRFLFLYHNGYHCNNNYVGHIVMWATATDEGLSRLGARGDVLVALESGMTVVDVSVTHPPGVALRAASAATDGSAAARRDAEKQLTARASLGMLGILQRSMRWGSCKSRSQKLTVLHDCAKLWTKVWMSLAPVQHWSPLTRFMRQFAFLLCLSVDIKQCNRLLSSCKA